MNDCNYLSGMLCVAGIAFLVAFDFLDSILTLALTASSRGFVMYRYLCSLLLFKAVSYLHDGSNQSATDLKSSIVYHFGCMTPKICACDRFMQHVEKAMRRVSAWG